MRQEFSEVKEYFSACKQVQEWKSASMIQLRMLIWRGQGVGENLVQHEMIQYFLLVFVTLYHCTVATYIFHDTSPRIFSA